MNLLRPLLALAVIAAAIAFSRTYSEHHLSANVFQQLYLHLMPAKLVHVAAHEEAGAAHESAATEHAEEQHAVAEHEGEVPGEIGYDTELVVDEVAAEDHPVGAALFTLPLPGFLGTTVSSIADGMAKDPTASERYGYRTQHADGSVGYGVPLTNLQIFQLAAVLLIFVLLGGVPAYVRTGRGDWLTRIFTGFSMWIRDEMVVPAMGRKTGAKYLPFFLAIFFFILFMNLLGLVPGSATATSSIFITGALAAITLFSMVICGMVVQGPIAFWKNLVPHVPWSLWLLMFVVELIGLMVKPFALMIRLFANMTGGHMVVLSFMGLIFFFATDMGHAAGYASSPVAIAFAAFIMIIEAFVAMLQAYIFTQLSIIFVNMSIHPEH